MDHFGEVETDGAHFVNADYNLWLKSQSNISEPESLNVERFDRYCHDKGLGKYIAVNRRVFALDLHRAQGSGMNADFDMVTRDALRTHHLRNGDHNLEMYAERMCLKPPPVLSLSAVGSGTPTKNISLQAGHFGWMVSCIKQLRNSGLSRLPAACSAASALEAAGFRPPVWWELKP